MTNERTLDDLDDADLLDVLRNTTDLATYRAAMRVRDQRARARIAGREQRPTMTPTANRAADTL